jgi:ElaB/YqjD/DUF883 family membrane-anchored ribosome-binding protein
LKDSITETAEDIRHAVSPEHIKSEVSDFVGRKTQTWISDLKDKALENPIQTLAAGAALTVPLMRLARGIPLPLLMIGAGLALTSKTVRARVRDAVDPLKDQAGQVLDQSRTAAQGFQDNVQQTASSVRGGAAGLADTAADAAGVLKDKATHTFDTLAGKASDGADAARDAAKDAFERLRSGAKETADAARDTAQQAPAKAREIIGDNAALIGGLGIAIGAIIAAALPPTDAETKVMGQASGNVRQAANDATASGFEAAKDAALSAADAVASSIADADLGKHASRMTEGVAERLKEAADGIVAAAFDPTRNSNTTNSNT